MLAARTIFKPAEYLRDVAKAVDFLDETDVKILSVMRKIGPRNLLEIARKSGLPFSTTYARVRALERMVGGPLATIIPAVSRLGLMRCEVLAEATRGNEDVVRRALKLTNYWGLLFTSEGPFTHFSVHAVPVRHMTGLRSYLEAVKKSGIVNRYEIFKTGEYYPVFPVFDGFDARSGHWKFEWKRWVKSVTEGDISRTLDDPERYDIRADETDLFILKELQKDGTKKFSQMGKMLGVTLQAVKYRFDRNIVGKNLINDYSLRILPYPPGLADLREIKIDFGSNRALHRFFSNAFKIPLVWGISKILQQNSLLVRTYTPRSEGTNLFRFLSDLVTSGVAVDYSSIRLDFESMEDQTISYELYSNESGWKFTLPQYLSELERTVKVAAR